MHSSWAECRAEGLDRAGLRLRVVRAWLVQWEAQGHSRVRGASSMVIKLTNLRRWGIQEQYIPGPSRDQRIGRATLL